MQLYDYYYEIHKNMKMIIFMDQEITSLENTHILIEDLMKLNSINVEYIIKTGVRNNIFLTRDDFSGNKMNKLIYFNKKGLLQNNLNRINSLDIISADYEEKITKILSDNSNGALSSFLTEVKKLILNGKIDRAHIIPFKPNNLIYELLSIDGVGTIIGKGFGNPEIKGATLKDVLVIKSLLDANSKKGFLKPRDDNYLSANYKNFLIAYIDQIPIGCVEIIQIDQDTIELGALSIIENFLCYKIGLCLIKFVESYAKNNNKTIISVTNNLKLEDIYLSNGYILDTSGEYSYRLQKSPGKKLYFKKSLIGSQKI